MNKKNKRQAVTFTETEYRWFLSISNTDIPVWPANWSRRKRNAMKARFHRETKEAYKPSISSMGLMLPVSGGQ